MSPQEKNKGLLAACEAGDVVLARHWLRVGANANTMDFSERPALHVTARQGSVELGRLLLEHGAHLTYFHRHIGTALHVSAGAKRLDFCVFLIDAGINLNVCSNRVDPVLAGMGTPASIRALLLRRGAFYDRPIMENLAAQCAFRFDPGLAQAMVDAGQEPLLRASLSDRCDPLFAAWLRARSARSVAAAALANGPAMG